MPKKKLPLVSSGQFSSFADVFDDEKFSSMEFRSQITPSKKRTETLSNESQINLAKIRLEKKGRGGKTVTVIYDIIAIGDLVKLHSKLKKILGVGGGIVKGNLEFSGDVRSRLKKIFVKKFNARVKCS